MAMDALEIPRLRGVSHAYAFWGALVAAVTLIVISPGGEARVAAAIYGAGLCALFGGSGLYHRWRWHPRWRPILRRVDHSMIFVFIAGTYTPFAVLTLPKTSSLVVLIVVWCGAVLGVALKSVWPTAPRALAVSLYLALGWVAVFLLPELLRSFGVVTLALLCAGGLIYTLGALAYGFKRPNPFPRTLGFHEVFHLCTLVAASCHYCAVWLAIFA
jgi:hemolysin III